VIKCNIKPKCNVYFTGFCKQLYYEIVNYYAPSNGLPLDRGLANRWKFGHCSFPEDNFPTLGPTFSIKFPSLLGNGGHNRGSLSMPNPTPPASVLGQTISIRLSMVSFQNTWPTACEERGGGVLVHARNGYSAYICRLLMQRLCDKIGNCILNKNDEIVFDERGSYR